MNSPFSNGRVSAGSARRRLQQKPPSPPFSLTTLLQPVGLDTFFSRYYERETLVIHREQPGYYDGLLSLQGLDELISATTLSCDEIVVVDHSRRIEPEDYQREDESVDTVQVHRLFDEGATVTLRQLQRRVATLGGLCRGVARQLSCACQTNLYFTPANAQGLETHHDTHDVFILQLAGSKRWQTYEPAVCLPLPGQRYYWKTPPTGLAAAAFTLHPGDLLYCPRGTPHDAQSVQEASVHISLGAKVSTWAELMIEIVADVALRDPAFRASLPPDFAGHGIPTQAMDGKLQDLFARLQQQARPSQMVEQLADRFISDQPAQLPGQAATLRAASALTLESAVGVRPGLVYRLSGQRGKVTLLCNSRRIALPDYAKPALDFALTSESFRVGDLPGSLTDSAKIVLVRRLMQEGAIVSMTTEGG
jgi:ribosomal protein L16 Arg81 hydroxylase